MNQSNQPGKLPQPAAPTIVSDEPEVIIQELSTELLKWVKETAAYKRGTIEYTVAFPSGDHLIIKLKR